MKKENPLYRWHLTAAEKEEIARRSAAGESKTQIARAMHITWWTVHKAYIKMGLSPVPKVRLLEKEVLEELEKGELDQREIGRKLGVPHRQVTKFAREHGYAHPRRTLSEAQLLGIISDILHRRSSAAQISRTRNASYKFVLQTAHSLLRCERFLSTRNTRLESYFPSRPDADDIPRDDTARALAIIEIVTSTCFAGELPHDTAGLIRICTEACLDAFQRENPAIHFGPDLWQQTREYLTDGFTRAVNTLRNSGSQLVN